VVLQTLVTKEWVAARFSEMFTVGAAGPRATKQQESVAFATNKLLVLAWAFINGLKKDDVKALSHSFGNFDRVVALGWLLGDAVGRPLLELGQAHTSCSPAALDDGGRKGARARLRLPTCVHVCAA